MRIYFNFDAIIILDIAKYSNNFNGDIYLPVSRLDDLTETLFKYGIKRT